MFLLLLALLSLPSIISLADDPAPGLLVSYEESRRLICERASLEAARLAYPGRVEETDPRGDFIERSAVLCTEPVMGEGRAPQDAAILADLSATATGIAGELSSRKLPPRAWLVEVHYPDAAVASKIGFAAKSALVGAGLVVTDRAPALSVDDIAVLAQTPVMEVYPAACRRYFAAGRLGPGDAVLSLAILDSRETALHAGACLDGEWTWLR